MQRSLFIFFVVSGIFAAFPYKAQSQVDSLRDTLRHFPSHLVEITALRPADLPLIDGCEATIKSAAELRAETGTALASDALRAMSSSMDIRRYGALGSIALASFRGLPPEYTIVFRDGVRLTNDQLGETDLGQVSLDGSSFVELVPSASAVLLGGDAVGAAINLVSRVADTARIRIETEQSSYAHGAGIQPQSYAASFSNSPSASLSVAAGGSLDQASGRLPLWDSVARRFILLDNNDALLRSAYLNTRWNMDTSTSLDLHSNYFFADRGIPSSPPARQSDEQAVLALRGETTFDGVQASMNVSYQSQWESYDLPIEHVADTALNRMMSVALKGIVPVTNDVTLYAGADFDHSRLAGTTNITPQGDSIIGCDHAAGYMALKYEPSQTLLVAASTRLEGFSDLAGAQVLPQATLTYELLSDLTADISYSRGFHAPTLNDLYWKGEGNPTLHPERANSAQAQLAWTHAFEGVRTELAATGFYAKIDDEILWVPLTASIFHPVNVAQVYSSGIEFRAAATVPIAHGFEFRGDESYTILHANDVTPGSIDSGHLLPYSARTRSLFIATVLSPWGSLACLVRYRGREYASLANDDPFGLLQPVTIYDLTLSTREFALGSIAVSVGASILNVTDEQYQEVLGYPLPRRTYKVSIQLNYH